MKKQYFFSFLLIFLIFPFVVLAQDIDISDEIKFSEKDTKDILHSLIQVLTNEWIELTSSSGCGAKEQASLITVRKTVRTEIMHYLLVEAPQEIAVNLIKTTLKAVYLIYTGDTRTLIDRIEKMTVDEAKKYAMEWLLQNEIRVASGNLTASYESYNGNKQEVVFPYIILYKPMGSKIGALGISIYSSQKIKPPIPTWKDPWEGGVEELSPFIIKINGNIGKGTGNSYRWIRTPNVEVVFDEEVPELSFPKPSFWDKQLASLKNTIRAIEIGVEFLNDFTRDTGETVKEKAKGALDKIKGLFSDFILFKAEVAPTPDDYLSLSDLLPDIGSLGIGKSTDTGSLGTEQPSSVSTEILLSEWAFAGIAERLDDVSEQIDIFGKEVNDFVEKESKKEEVGLPNVEPAEVRAPQDEDLLNAEDLLNEDLLDEDISDEKEVLQSEDSLPQTTRDGFPSSLGEVKTCQTAGLSAAEVRPAQNKVIFNEIAWMGTGTSSADEWIELKNVSGAKVNLEGWQVLDKDGQIEIVFGADDVIEPGGFYLLERTDDGSVPRLTADFIYTGALSNSNEAIYLFAPDCEFEDIVEAMLQWPAGNSSSKKSMERNSNLEWYTFNGRAQGEIFGTPREKNSDPNAVYYGGGGGGGGGTPPPPEPEPEPEPVKILITEIQISGEKANYDFIELYNPGKEAADISGWQLKKRTQDGTEYSVRLFSENIFIPAQSYWIWASSKDDYQDIVQAEVSSSAYLITNNSIALLDRDKNIRDALAWGSGHTNPFLENSPFSENPAENQSIERKKDEKNDYIDTDNNSDDFELQNCPNPKTQVIACYSPPDEEEPAPPDGGDGENDITPPELSFKLEAVQTGLSFIVSWSAIDPIADATPSGLDGFLLRYSEDQENWIYFPEENQYTQETQYEFSGQDQHAYYFQIKAIDKADNESDWKEAETKIDLAKEPEPEIGGCIDPEALNYNPEATKDDGSCEYAEPEPETPTQTIVINEIAWMGTEASSNDEWLELYNTNENPVDIAGWKLIFYPIGQIEPRIINFNSFSETTSAVDGFDYFLLERTDDTTISDIHADYIYTGALNDDGGILELRDDQDNLIDTVDCFGGWFVGEKAAVGGKKSMERINPENPGSNPDNWKNNNPDILCYGLDADKNNINGTPKHKNSNSFLDKIIYVDKNLIEDDPANHFWDTVQEGIDDAREGWLVIVKPGIYWENVQIAIPDLILCSEQGFGETSIQSVDSDKNILEIKADNIEIKGFSFQGAGSYKKTGLFLDRVKKSLIRENKFSQNYLGIHLTESNENAIQTNIFEENRQGIYLENSENNTIIQNTINSKRYIWHAMTCGIYLNSSNNNVLLENTANDKGLSNFIDSGETHGICIISSNENILEKNTAQNNKGTGDGIYIKDSNNNIIKDSVLKDNNRGLALLSSNNNTLDSNTADNNIVGIYLGGSANILKNNQMTDNCIANFAITFEPNLNNEIDTTNLVQGKKIYYLREQSDIIIDSSSEAGIVHCFNCQNITIKDLILDGRNDIGIYFYQTNNSLIENVEVTESVLAIILEESNDNVIKGNFLHKNFRGLNLSESNNNKISGNVFEENDSQGTSPCFGTSPRYGISLSQSTDNEVSGNLIVGNPNGLELFGSCSRNTFFENTIKDNTYQGVAVFCSSNNLFYHNNFIDNAGNNWGSCAPYSPRNKWHNSDLSEGNYYSDYCKAVEDCSDSDINGIWDKAYPWNRDNDEYPFVLPDGWK